MDGHRIYINDGGTVWNPGWQPAKTALDHYTCRHGLGYSIFEGEKNGIAATQEVFVPRGDACEIDRLTLEIRRRPPHAGCVQLCGVLPVGCHGRQLQLPAQLLHR